MTTVHPDGGVTAHSAAGSGSPTVHKGVESIAPKWLRFVFLLNLIAQTGIVLTGGLVRVTKSGLGCPTWPQCAPGSYTPTQHQEQSWHKYIEFGNRSLTFVLSILAIVSIAGALIWARNLRKSGATRRTPLIWLAAVPLVGTFVQAVLGGITVLTGLNPAIVAAHFLLSSGLIAGCLVLYVRSGERGDQPKIITVKQPIRILSNALVVITVMVLTLGTVVTGSGPNSGDATDVARFGFDPRSIAWMHADLVMVFVGLSVGLLVALYVADSPALARKRAWLLFAMIMVQGVIGYAQYFTGLPWVAVLMHLLGACLVWIAVIGLSLATRSRGIAVAS